MFKPMKRREYERWIARFGWKLVKAGMDWKVIDADGHIVILNVIITHPGGEIPPISIQKTKRALKERGFL